MYLENGGLLTWRYKYFHDFLMRRFLDVHFSYVVMYFDDIYYALIMFGRMYTRKWDPGTVFPNGMGWRALLIVGVQDKQWDPGIFFVPLISIFLGNKKYGRCIPHLIDFNQSSAAARMMVPL